MPLSSRPLAFVALCTGLCSACFSDPHTLPDVIEAQIEPSALNIGAMVPLSEGPGLSHRNAILLACETVNAAGRPAGFRVHPVIVDSAPLRMVGREAVGAELRRRAALMASHGLPALLAGSGLAALEAAAAAAQSDITVLAYGAGSGSLIQGAHSGAEQVVSLMPSHRALAGVLSELAEQAGYRRLGILYAADDPTGTGLADALEAAFLPGGRSVLRGALPATDFVAQISRGVATLLSDELDAIVPILPPEDAARVVNEATIQRPDTGWLLPHTTVSSAFGQSLARPELLDGAMAVAPAFGQGVAFTSFAAAMVERFQSPPGSLDALAFDALMMAALAAHRAAREHALPQGQSPTAQELLGSLPAITNPPGETLSWEELDRAFELLDAGAEIEYVGAYAGLDLLDGGASGELPVQIFRFDGSARHFGPQEQRSVLNNPAP